MSETRWYFGYRRLLYEDKGSLCWYGRVFAPRSHPVRSLGLGDEIVLLCRDSWVVFFGGKTRFKVLDAVQLAAAKLRSIQNDWDRLSPYEREYRIW